MSDRPTASYFSVPQPLSADPVPEGTLPAGWSLKPLLSRKERQSFYDTFEWQAFEKGFAVIRKKHNLVVTDLDTGNDSALTELKGSPASFFPDALPAGKASGDDHKHVTNY